MTFGPKHNSREHILLMGSWGTGKSYAWFSIAKRCPESHFYVIDTFYDAERMIEGSGLENVTIFPCHDWDESDSALQAIMNKAGKDDWLIVDLIDQIWDQAQSGFVNKAFGKDIDDWFLQYRKDHPSGGHALAGEYGTNWSVINKMYGSFMGSVLRFPGHVLACTPVDSVQQPDRAGKGGDSADVIRIFGRLGVKPKGQKNLGHQFHTVLLMQEKGDEWTMTTVRDRNRERQAGIKVEDFGIQYLMKVAEWRP